MLWVTRSVIQGEAQRYGMPVPAVAYDAAASGDQLSAALGELRAERNAHVEKINAEHDARAEEWRRDRTAQRDQEAGKLLGLQGDIIKQVRDLRAEARGARASALRAETLRQQRIDTARAAELERQANSLIAAH